MNMILVDGVEVKKQFLKICEDIQSILLKSVHEYVEKTASEMKERINKIIDTLKEKAENEEKIVELEKLIDKIEKEEDRKLKAEFVRLK